MRTPSYEDLSKEQDKFCVLAPLDSATLVSGPPGTGKTVVTFYRVETAAKKGQTPKLVMFNNVLFKYSSNASKSRKVRDGINTWQKWLTEWWRTVFGSWFPQVERYVPDWESMIPKVLGMGSQPAVRDRALQNWGHLIVDEGQDFSTGFYRMASVVIQYSKAAARQVSH